MPPRRACSAASREATMFWAGRLARRQGGLSVGEEEDDLLAPGVLLREGTPETEKLDRGLVDARGNVRGPDGGQARDLVEERSISAKSAVRGFTVCAWRLVRRNSRPSIGSDFGSVAGEGHESHARAPGIEAGQELAGRLDLRCQDRVARVRVLHVEQGAGAPSRRPTTPLALMSTPVASRVDDEVSIAKITSKRRSSPAREDARPATKTPQPELETPAPFGGVLDLEPDAALLGRLAQHRLGAGPRSGGSPSGPPARGAAPARCSSRRAGRSRR